MHIKFHDLEIEQRNGLFELNYTIDGVSDSLSGGASLEDSMNTWLSDVDLSSKLRHQLEEVQDECSDLGWDEEKIAIEFASDDYSIT